MDPVRGSGRTLELPLDWPLQEPERTSDAVNRYRHHVCAFFHSAEERYRVLLPFIKQGFEKGEKGVHIVDPAQRKDHVRRLEASGIDVAAAERDGRFELLDWNTAYWREHGQFDPQSMLRLLKEALGDQTAGSRPTRLIAHMEWAALDASGSQELVKYETEFNRVFPECRDWVVCSYDISQFSGDLIIDILRTHPMVIMGGVLQENPFFVPPQELLRELENR